MSMADVELANFAEANAAALASPDKSRDAEVRRTRGPRCFVAPEAAVDRPATPV